MTAERESPPVDMLRIATAGSVDDGKSSLIGRLLYDSKAILEDQLSAIEHASRQRGNGYLELALLTDGLRAEREQNITIDVAYRYFSTPRRKFIIADTPGHVQYTRNMVTGTSTADVSVILVDARKGVLTQSRRHAAISTLLGVRHLVIAVNKMDLVDFDEGVFRSIETEFRAFLDRLGAPPTTFIPISALLGDNVVENGGRTPWYDGPPLLEFLERLHLPTRAASAFRLSVQYVVRPHQDYRGFAGPVEGGSIRVGDPVQVARTGIVSRVRSIHAAGESAQLAVTGQPAVIELEDEVDVSRGDLLCSPTTRNVVVQSTERPNPPTNNVNAVQSPERPENPTNHVAGGWFFPPDSGVRSPNALESPTDPDNAVYPPNLTEPRTTPITTADRVEAVVCWFNEVPLEVGRRYILLHTMRRVPAVVEAVLHRVDADTLDRLAATGLGMNDIGHVVVHSASPLFFDPYRENPAMGSFVLVDPGTNATVGAGMIQRAWDSGVDKAPRQGEIIWLGAWSSQGEDLAEHARRLGRSAVFLDSDLLPGETQATLARLAASLAAQGFDTVIAAPPGNLPGHHLDPLTPPLPQLDRLLGVSPAPTFLGDAI